MTFALLNRKKVMVARPTPLALPVMVRAFFCRSGRGNEDHGNIGGVEAWKDEDLQSRATAVTEGGRGGLSVKSPVT